VVLLQKILKKIERRITCLDVTKLVPMEMDLTPEEEWDLAAAEMLVAVAVVVVVVMVGAVAVAEVTNPRPPRQPQSKTIRRMAQKTTKLDS